MTREEKWLLLKDLCARQLYGVKIEIGITFLKDVVSCHKLKRIDVEEETINGFYIDSTSVKPYLRPMSSMTEEEYSEFLNTQKMDCGDGNLPKYEYTYKTFDWLNKKMFDYRDLIGKGLALKAPEGMYNF